MITYDHLEIARIIGEPKDPRRPYPDLVNAVCEVDSADPNEYVYYFDVYFDTDYVITTVASGVTQTNVSPYTPTLFTFVDVATNEYYVKVTDLATSKERVLARKKATINRSLNARENAYIVGLLDAAAIARGNLNDLRSGETSFNYRYVIDMMDQIIDYSETYVLAAGTAIDKDIKMMDWKDNKFQSSIEAFKALGIEVLRIAEPYYLDNSSQAAALNTNICYLVGVQTEMGKPLLFVRKRMNEIEKLGGVISETGDKAERLVFVSPNPVQVSTTRYLAVALTGYEQIVAATINSYAISKFTRTV
jgi:hypothetical protein